MNIRKHKTALQSELSAKILTDLIKRFYQIGLKIFARARGSQTIKYFYLNCLRQGTDHVFLLNAIRRATNGGFVLGSERFQKQIAAMLGRRTWPGAPGRPRKIEGGDAQNELGFYNQWSRTEKRGLSFIIPPFRWRLPPRARLSSIALIPSAAHVRIFALTLPP